MSGFKWKDGETAEFLGGPLDGKSYRVFGGAVDVPLITPVAELLKDSRTAAKTTSYRMVRIHVTHSSDGRSLLIWPKGCS